MKTLVITATLMLMISASMASAFVEPAFEDYPTWAGEAFTGPKGG